MSNDIVVATIGDIDVKAHVPVTADFSFGGSVGTLGVTATDNAMKNAYVAGNSLVQTLGSPQGDGQVRITSGGGITVLSQIDGGGGGSLLFTGTYFTSTATDNAVYQSAVIGSVFSGGATRVEADDGVVIGSHASHPLDYGIDVESKVTSVSVSLLVDDNAATVNATSNTSMLASVTGGAVVDAGGGTASVSAGGDLKTYGEARGGGGSAGVSIDRPSVTAHGNATFTASVDGLNPIQAARVTGADVEVEATGGERGIWNEALITGGSGSGLVAVGAGSATSTEDSTLTASVLDNADLNADGDLLISSTSDVNVFAKVFGGLGSGGVTVDAPSATATTNTTEQAYIDGSHHQASISGQYITIASGGVFTAPDNKSRVHTRAEINGGSGAGLVDVATASANAADKSDFEAYVVGDVSAAADQAVFVNAVATGAVESEINGGSGAGLVDVTAMSVKATGKSKRTAYVAGPDTRVTVPTGGLVVRSDGFGGHRRRRAVRRRLGRFCFDQWRKRGRPGQRRYHHRERQRKVFVDSICRRRGARSMRRRCPRPRKAACRRARDSTAVPAPGW